MKTTTKVLWLIAGLLEIALGIYCLCNPSVIARTLAILLGVVILVSGLAAIAAYFSGMHAAIGSGWLLVYGFASAFLGLMTFFSDSFQGAVGLLIPLCLALWMVMKGACLFAFSLDAKHADAPRWWLILAAGLLCLTLGLCCFILPMLGVAILGVAFGLFLIVSGLSTMVEWRSFLRLERLLEDTFDDHIKEV